MLFERSGVLLIGAIWATQAAAATTIGQLSLTTETALKGAQAAMASCQQKHYSVSVAVVDSAGHLKVLLRDDQAGPHTLDSSQRKAYTALTLRKPTHELARQISNKSEIQALGWMNEKILILGGGLPVVIQDQVVGAIGVGGAPGAMLDVVCAQAGIRAILDR